MTKILNAHRNAAGTFEVAYGWSGTPAVTMRRNADWPKAAGAKPTAHELQQAASILKRTGTAKHLALAMYLRPDGATQTEVIHATGDTQVNAYSEAHRNSNWLVRAVNGRNGHKAYALALPGKPKGKPAKGKRKPAKGKVSAKVTKGTSEPAKGTSEPAKGTSDGNATS